MAMMQTFRDMGQVKLAAMGGAAVLMLGAFMFLSMRFSNPNFTPLYSGLEMSDSSHIAAELDKQGVKYELQANGSQILVPSDQVLKLRLNLAGQGIPSGGSVVGYEIFDRSEALGTSNFVLNVNMLRALEGELARTIGSFSQVESARVHLVVPKRELFSRDKQEPTASVALKLRGSELGKNEIAAIRNLVATAVPGLKANAITIVDNRGRMLAKGGAGEDPNMVSASDSAEYRANYETRVKSTVEDLLEQSLGAGKVKAQVAADIDFDRVVTNSEKFDPEGQVVRSVQTGQEKEASNDGSGGSGGNVSVAGNLPDAQKQGGATSERNTQSTNETTNYEISKTVENHIRESGTVKRLSVAVLVDGTYTTDAEGKQTYAPRSEEELKQLEAVVRTAVGYDEKRGDDVKVVNMQFQNQATEALEESAFDWLKRDMQGIIQTLVMGGVAILAILLIIRPLVNRVIESAAASAAREPQLTSGDSMIALEGPSAMPRLASPASGSVGASSMSLPDEREDEEGLINLQRVQGRIKSSSFRKINEIVDKHPDETMNVLRSWIFKEM